MKLITVVTLDDHDLVRQGIRSLLADQPDIKLVGEGSAGEHLPVLAARHKPNIVLLDIGMPQKEAALADAHPDNAFRVLPAIARLRTLHPETQIIIVSQYESQAIIEGALDLGVRGYLLKDDALSRQLADAIRTVSWGGLYFSPEIEQQLTRGGSHRSKDAILTLRQQEILQALANNPSLSYPQIAERLGISEHTFNNHLRKIYERLEAANKLEALLTALRMGLISIENMNDPRQNSPDYP
ncbi:MAG: LuxR C-terminal-related transcriptional regulator [Anaerolineae bacterium]